MLIQRTTVVWAFCVAQNFLLRSIYSKKSEFRIIVKRDMLTVFSTKSMNSYFHVGVFVKELRWSTIVYVAVFLKLQIFFSIPSIFS